MPNILINPSSGILEFNTGIAGGSVFDTSLSGAARLTFNSGEINLVSYSTGVTDRFTVDGAAGRLFSVSDALTGSIFSVNDIAGLPLIEVVSTTGDTITIGPYNTNTLVVKDTRVGIGTGVPSYLLDVNGTGYFRGPLYSSGVVGVYASYTNDSNYVRGTITSTTSSIKLSAEGTGSGSSGNTDISLIPKVNGRIYLGGNGTYGGLIVDSSAAVKKILREDGAVAILEVVPNGNPVAFPYGLAVGSYVGNNPSTIPILVKDSNHVLAQLNTTNPQTYRIYNTYTDTGSFERGKIGWNSNVLEIGTEQGATGGSPRNLALITSGQQRFTVTSDGNVGVGTSTPSSNLEVYGATKIASARNNQFPLTIYGGNSSAQACHVLLYNNVTRGVLKAGGNGLDGQGFADSSYNYLLFVSGNGNVGVGTTSPSYKLDVDGTGNFRSGLYSNGNPVLTTASSNVVFTTGNQVIVGNKTFSGDLKASSLSIEPGNLTINDNVFSGAVMSLSEGSSFVINGIGGSQIDLYGQTITGFSIYSNDIYKNGYSVLTTNDTGNFLTTSSNAVYTTGNQTIAGEKTFSSTIKSSNTSSIFQANGGNLSGNLEIIKIGNYYSFRLGQVGWWDEEYGNSTQLTLGNGLNGDGSNPGFTLYDFSNGGTLQVGGLISYGPYNGSTIRIGPDGIALWGNDGGDITIANGGVGINTNGGSPSYNLDVAGSIKGNEYFSSAGNSGVTTSITVYDQNALMNKTLNFENGLLISIT